MSGVAIVAGSSFRAESQTLPNYGIAGSSIRCYAWVRFVADAAKSEVMILLRYGPSEVLLVELFLVLFVVVREIEFVCKNRKRYTGCAH